MAEEKVDNTVYPPMPPDQIQRVIKFLHTKKDSFCLAQAVCKKFAVKRQQLVDAGFSVSAPGKVCVVAPPGMPAPENLSKEDLWEELTPEKVQEIQEYLESKDPPFDEVGNINSWFDVRTPQLQAAGFVCSEKNAHGAMNLSVPGSEPAEIPLTGAEMREKGIRPKGSGKVGKGGGKKSGRGGWDDWNNGGWVDPMMMQQCMMQMWQMMQSKGGMMGKGMGGKAGGKGKRKDEGPVTPMEEQTKQEVVDFLTEAPATTVAVLGAKFKVGKRQLLEAGFVTGPPNESGQIGVAPPGCPTPEPPAKVIKLAPEAAPDE